MQHVGHVATCYVTSVFVTCYENRCNVTCCVACFIVYGRLYVLELRFTIHVTLPTVVRHTLSMRYTFMFQIDEFLYNSVGKKAGSSIQ